MSNYEQLSKEIADKIRMAKSAISSSRYALDEEKIIRRYPLCPDNSAIWQPTLVQDVHKILHCPYYSRYTDKTQVFSLYKNDDITRRSLHVQLVSRIARTIGAALNLNLDLIEAIGLGHDIGHTPFGHTGEAYLDKLYYKNTGRHFYHNIHSVRVLDGIFSYNLSLQTLDGIVGHNGEQECEIYYPRPMGSFEEFDKMIERCYIDPEYTKNIMPSTLEGSVVRMADIIAYIGKDRLDAQIVNTARESMFTDDGIGSEHSEIVNNLVVNIIENSYGKPYIKLDTRHFKAMQKARLDNYSIIYNSPVKNARLGDTVRLMMENIYGQMLDDLLSCSYNSPIFTHHISYVNSNSHGNPRSKPYEKSEANQIVVDYIASMTDDYFIELHDYLFPESKLKVTYQGYFDE